MRAPDAETQPAETPMTPAETPTTRAAWMLTPEQAAANVTATQEAVAAVRRAMAQGEMDKAVEQIDLAELDAIENEAIDQVDETRAKLEYLRGFWRAVDEGFKELKAGQEFEFEGRTSVVVERTPERLVVRSSGRNLGYERRKLPPEVALFLATRWLKTDDANTPLFLAAFHVFDADGDPKEARRLLEAANAAKTAGAAELLAELDAAAPKN
jgi:hypothetical protein